jgi:hypothetical protein
MLSLISTKCPKLFFHDCKDKVPLALSRLRRWSRAQTASLAGLQSLKSITYLYIDCGNQQQCYDKTRIWVSLAMTEPKIPKFGSFRPAKPLVSPDVAQAHASEPLTKQRTTKKHEISGTQEGHRQRSHRRRRSQSREKSNSRHLHNEPLCSRDSHPVDIFVVDRRGDEKNLVYGSIHRYNIPPFHRYGAGHILGLSTEFKIDRNFPDDKDIILFNWKDSRGKTREKYIFSRAAKNKPRLLKIRPECFIENSVAEDENFVPLSASKSRKRKRGDIKADTNVDDTESEKDERDYRSIYGKGKTGDNLLDDELRYVTESESSGSDAG